MTDKNFAILIPCYNASLTIKETLLSVQEAIKETSKDIPVFVYDDCSTDNSVAIARQAWQSMGRFEVIKGDFNSGERKTTNRAFNDFNGQFEWVFILHADDIAKKDWLTSLIGLIMRYGNDQCFTIWSSFDSFNSTNGRVLDGDNSGNINHGSRSTEEIRHFLTRVYGAWHISGAAINVALLLSLEGFDENLAQFGDTDFFVRGLMAGFRDIYLSRTLTKYRTSDSSVSSVSLRTNRDIREIFYMVKKFRNSLTKAEISSMYGIVVSLSARRTVKSLLKGNIELTMLNFKQLGKSLLYKVRV